MPIYEYYSPDTHRIYSFLARRSGLAGRIPRCPDGAGHRMQRVPSRFAFIGRAREPLAGSDVADDDPRFEHAMTEIEREFAGMDDENPDPRQLGRMMRRMADLTGERIPPDMQELIGRLEAGEDPDKLEEEFADAFDEDGDGEAIDEDEGEGAGGTGSGGHAQGRRRDRLRALLGRRPPKRDPKLYEFDDFL